MAPRIALSCVGPASWDTSPKNPHVRTLFKVYVNPAGEKAMASEGKKPFPAGSILVKEKYEAPASPQRDRPAVPSKNAKPVLLTVMIKREKGFSAPTGDWEYRVYTGDGQRSTGDGLKHCAGCHETQKESGYVFGSYNRGVFTGHGHFEPLPPGL
ncbi:hypothetical protein BH11ARM2_BH11ARM2_24900 [soil metagenome]